MASRHPKKHIEEAVQYAILLGWRLESSQGMPGPLVVSGTQSGRVPDSGVFDAEGS